MGIGILRPRQIQLISHIYSECYLLLETSSLSLHKRRQHSCAFLLTPYQPIQRLRRKGSYLYSELGHFQNIPPTIIYALLQTLSVNTSEIYQLRCQSSYGVEREFSVSKHHICLAYIILSLFHKGKFSEYLHIFSYFRYHSIQNSSSHVLFYRI